MPAPAQTASFELSSAALLVNAAHATYAATAQRWAADNGFSSCTNFDHANIQGFWAFSADGNTALLAFRGTSNVGQWIRDARFLWDPHPWGSVHRGFHRGLEAVEEALRGFDAVAKDAHRVWVTGHSLGGALAVLAMARLRLGGIDATAYTFGQPRIGLSGFRERFELELPQRLYRIVNQADLIPRLPPGLLYRHCGIVRRIVRPGVLQSLQAGSEDDAQPVLSDSELPPLDEARAEAVAAAFDADPEAALGVGLQPEGVVPSMFKDHFIGEYRRLICEIANSGRTAVPDDLC